jgi:hypothetical protein
MTVFMSFMIDEFEDNTFAVCNGYRKSNLFGDGMPEQKIHEPQLLWNDIFIFL